MKIHFDGDLLVYRAGFAAEKAVYHVGHLGAFHDFESKKEANAYCDDNDIPREEIVSERELEPVGHALYNTKSILRTTMEKLGSDDITVYLSGPTNFRTGIATIKPYKGNRDETHKPAHGPAIKEYLEKNYDTVYSVDEEADDLVAYSHRAMWREDADSSVLASTDKDLDMVPGLHYNFVKDRSYYVAPEEGIRWFYTQLLTGDSTDNIPGVPRIGPVNAEAILADIADDEWSLYQAVRALYIQGYPDMDPDAALLENAQLLWMRTKPNEWWRPPKDESEGDRYYV